MLARSYFSMSGFLETGQAKSIKFCKNWPNLACRSIILIRSIAKSKKLKISPQPAKRRRKNQRKIRN
jgi:hypothetical protein